MSAPKFTVMPPSSQCIKTYFIHQYTLSHSAYLALILFLLDIIMFLRIGKISGLLFIPENTPLIGGILFILVNFHGWDLLAIRNNAVEFIHPIEWQASN